MSVTIPNATFKYPDETYSDDAIFKYSDNRYVWYPCQIYPEVLLVGKKEGADDLYLKEPILDTYVLHKRKVEDNETEDEEILDDETEDEEIEDGKTEDEKTGVRSCPLSILTDNETFERLLYSTHARRASDGMFIFAKTDYSRYLKISGDVYGKGSTTGSDSNWTKESAQKLTVKTLPCDSGVFITYPHDMWIEDVSEGPPSEDPPSKSKYLSEFKKYQYFKVTWIAKCPSESTLCWFVCNDTYVDYRMPMGTRWRGQTSYIGAKGEAGGYEEGSEPLEEVAKVETFLNGVKSDSFSTSVSFEDSGEQIIKVQMFWYDVVGVLHVMEDYQKVWITSESETDTLSTDYFRYINFKLFSSFVGEGDTISLFKVMDRSYNPPSDSNSYLTEKIQDDEDDIVEVTTDVLKKVVGEGNTYWIQYIKSPLFERWITRGSEILNIEPTDTSRYTFEEFSNSNIAIPSTYQNREEHGTPLSTSPNLIGMGFLTDDDQDTYEEDKEIDTNDPNVSISFMCVWDHKDKWYKGVDDTDPEIGTGFCGKYIPLEEPKEESEEDAEEDSEEDSKEDPVYVGIAKYKLFSESGGALGDVFGYGVPGVYSMMREEEISQTKASWYATEFKDTQSDDITYYSFKGPVFYLRREQEELASMHRDPDRSSASGGSGEEDSEITADDYDDELKRNSMEDAFVWIARIYSIGSEEEDEEDEEEEENTNNYKVEWRISKRIGESSQYYKNIVAFNIDTWKNIPVTSFTWEGSSGSSRNSLKDVWGSTIDFTVELEKYIMSIPNFILRMTEEYSSKNYKTISPFSHFKGINTENIIIG